MQIQRGNAREICSHVVTSDRQRVDMLGAVSDHNTSHFTTTSSWHSMNIIGATLQTLWSPALETTLQERASISLIGQHPLCVYLLLT